MIRLSERWLAILLATYAFGITLWLTVHNAQSLIDDGFYYFKIAEHLARGEGSTFDGVHLTNGYHPLWAFLLIPIYAILPADESARSVASIVQATFFAASVAMFYATVRLNFRRGTAIIATLAWLLFAYRLSLSGTEFSLQALCITLVAFLYLHWFRKDSIASKEKYLALGILLSITFLARVETLVLAFFIGFGFTTTPRKFFFFTLPLILVCFSYALANFIIFDYPLPISGAVKRAWSDYYLTASPTFQIQGWRAAKIDTALIPIRALFTLRRFYEIIFPFYLVAGVLWCGSTFRVRMARPALALPLSV